MEPLALFCALLSSLSWGSADFVGGMLSRRVHSTTVVFWSALWVPPVLAGGLAICGVAASGDLVAAGAFAGTIGAFGLILLYRALALGMMGVIAPITASSVAVPVIVDIARGNVPATTVSLGMALAIGGVIWLASGERQAGEDDTAPNRRWAVVLAVGAALCFGWFLTVVGSAEVSGIGDALWLVVGVRIATTISAVVGVVVQRAAFRASPRDAGIAAASGGMDAAANALYAVAAGLGSLGPTAVVASLYPLVTIAGAHIMLGQRLQRLQVLAVVVVLVGVSCVAAGSG